MINAKYTLALPVVGDHVSRYHKVKRICVVALRVV